MRFPRISRWRKDKKAGRDKYAGRPERAILDNYNKRDNRESCNRPSAGLKSDFRYQKSAKKNINKKSITDRRLPFNQPKKFIIRRLILVDDSPLFPIITIADCRSAD